MKIKNLFTYLIIFIFLNNISFAQKDNNLKLMQLMLDTAKTDKSRADIYFLMASKVDSIAPESLLFKALEIYQHTDNYYGLIKTYNALIHLYRLTSQQDKAVYYIQNMIDLEEQNKNPVGVAECKRMLGDVYRSMCFYGKAFKELHQALHVMNEMKNSIGIMNTNNRLAAVCYENILVDRRYLDSTEYYVSKSYQLSLKLSDTSLILNNLNILGGLFLYRGKPDSSLDYYYKTYYLLIKSKADDVAIPNLLCNIANVYKTKGNSDSVIFYATMAFNIATEHNIPVDIIRSSGVLAIEYEELKNWEKAYFYLTKANQYQIQSKKAEITDNIIESEKKFDLRKLEAVFHRDKLQKVIAALIIGIFILVIGGLIIRHKNIKKSKFELIDINDKVNDQNKLLEELNITKDKFFSIIAHDLRNPIGNLIQITEMLQSNYQSLSESDKTEWIEELGDTSKSIYSLLENLLTWSKTQRNLMQFTPEPVDLNYLINEISKLLKTSAQSKNIELKLNLVENVLVFADANFLNTILRNLISNAIKFTENGGLVEIETILIDNFVHVNIKDSGIGIPEENLPNLFKIDSKFYRKGTSGEPSSGLGLVLCKEFTIKNGGELWVKSKIGSGSVFSFSIPRNPN